jgi:hypothetical protein
LGHRGRSVNGRQVYTPLGSTNFTGWKTFLRNHAAGIASIDLFVARIISFKLLYGLVILDQLRRRLIRVSVTTNPTAPWIAGQVTEAFPWMTTTASAPGPGRLIRFGIHPTRSSHGNP